MKNIIREDRGKKGGVITMATVVKEKRTTRFRILRTCRFDQTRPWFVNLPPAILYTGGGEEPWWFMPCVRARQCVHRVRK